MPFAIAFLVWRYRAGLSLVDKILVSLAFTLLGLIILVIVRLWFSEDLLP